MEGIDARQEFGWLRVLSAIGNAAYLPTGKQCIAKSVLTAQEAQALVPSQKATP
ncbi:hypothetical protein ACU4GI_19015 [Cupriavidus basilensis]